MKGAPRSVQFDDIYFSAENGLEETKHVFLEGNNLPQRWEGKKHFTIAETGFGTGLNFLSVWKLFEETSRPDQQLDFVSFEKYPLTPQDIREALIPWQGYFGPRIESMLSLYPIRVAGFHRLKLSPQITLTLIFDDINLALPELDAVIDCWFLDGFTPAKNPDMWTEILFNEMARLSDTGASYATFTAAGDVRRGLEAAGFSVEKKNGFGRKRDMIAGNYQGKEKNRQEALSTGSRIAIIGGGLTGTACAYTLKQYGFNPVIYEQADQLANGASGNDIGMFNPRFTAQRDAVSEFFAPAYAQIIQLLKNLEDDVGYNPCGALHIMNSPEKEKRFHALVQNWRWHKDHVQIVDRDKASKIAGIQINQDCLYLPDSGSVSPAKLCHYLAKDTEVNLNSTIASLDEIEADGVIVASGAGINQFDILNELPVNTVRGQITTVQSPKILQTLQCNLHYGGYVSATRGGQNTIGATFQRWLDHDQVLDEDHDDNIAKLCDAVGEIKPEHFEVVAGRAGLRVAAKDHFPIVGKIPDMNHKYAATAFGSHGLVGTLAAARLIADTLRAGLAGLPCITANALSLHRFLDKK